MKAAVYYSNDNVTLQDVPVPEIDEGGILVKTKACGICMADTMEWYQKPKAPVILGHEATGIVEKAGQKTKGFSVGDRVFVHHHVPCMTCEHCHRQNYTLCHTFKKTNYDPGGFCEYFAVSPLHLMDTLILPDSVSFEGGTLIEPLACAVHAVRINDAKPHDRVVIVGAGSIGIMLALVLKAYGVRNVVFFEIDEWRAQKAHAITGNTVLIPKNTAGENEKAYRELVKADRANKVFVVAKDIKAMELGLEITADGGTALLFATPRDDEYLPFNVCKAFFKQLTVRLSYSADHLDTREALALISNGKVNAESLITHKFSLEEVSKGIKQTEGRGDSLKCIVVV